MRPKRRVLLIDTQEDRQAVTRFVLVQHQYHVLSASSVYEAAEVGHNDAPNLLLGFAPLSEQYLMEVAAALDAPWLYIQPQLESEGLAVLWPTMADVLQRIKVACSRKRGPKPGTPRPARLAVPGEGPITALSKEIHK